MYKHHVKHWNMAGCQSRLNWNDIMQEMKFALYIDIVSIFHNILRELFQFDFSIDEHLKLLSLVSKRDK